MGKGAIEVRDLRVDYGDLVAVDDVSLSVPYGEVFGLVGPNGAGKTSAFKVLATLMDPTYGEVSLDGLDVLEETEQAREILGYMPDLAPVPSDLRAWEFLADVRDEPGAPAVHRHGGGGAAGPRQDRAGAQRGGVG